MSKFSFSPSQKDAVNSLNEELLVSAGAGSGKTTVLVERILHYIKNGGEIGSVLALTFTNAAAADMCAKLDRSISALLEQDPENSHLRRQLSLLPQAHISTIHSFCLELLRENYFMLGLPAGFKVAAENDIILLKKEILESYMEASYEKEESHIAELADMYGGEGDDSDLQNVILDLHTFCRSRTETFDWLDAAAAGMAAENLEELPFAVYLFKSIHHELDRAEELLSNALDEAGDFSFDYQNVIDTELYMVRNALSAQSLEEVLECLSDIVFDTLRKRKDDDADRHQYIKEKRNQAKKIIQDMQKAYCEITPAQHWERIHSLAAPMKALADLVRGFDKDFSAAKLDKGWVDFGDMELYTLRLLEDEKLCGQVQERYTQVLIDEYQDINEVQEKILGRLRGSNTIFAVGDVKQSIYRFRLAEPELFMRKYELYGQRQGGRRIDLNCNYRSEKAIIDGVNYIFSRLMCRSSAELDYDDAARLHTEKTEASPIPELMLIDMDTENGKKPPFTAIEAEAELICRRICLLHQQGYAYGDMAVLLRNMKNKDNAFVSRMTAYGIPVVYEGGKGYMESPEAQLILSCLQMIDNPLHDIPLAAVMRSVLGGFSPKELADIRSKSRKGAFYHAVKTYAEKADALAEKCRAFLDKLDSWRHLAGEQSVSRLLLALYGEKGYYQLVGAMKCGNARQADLQLMLQEAYDYESGDYQGLFRFIRRLEQIRREELNSAAPAVGGSVDSVHLMSIHKSKGLEFPVVFVAGLAGNFNFSDGRQNIIFQRELGLGAVASDRSRRRKYETLCRIAVRDKLKELTMAEEIRIYYVALTRAKERLILVSAAKNMRENIMDWAARAFGFPMDIDFIRSAKCPLTWIGGALMQNINVVQLLEEGISQGADETKRYWKVSLDKAEQIFSLQADGAEEKAAYGGKEISAATADALGYRYPDAETAGLPIKFTVTGMIRAEAGKEKAVRYTHDEQELSDHSPIDAEKAAARGTATHALLENIEKADSTAPEALTALAVKLARQGKIDESVLDIIDMQGISSFLGGELGQRLLSAAKVCRELPFTMLVQEDDPFGPVIQGIIDAVFWDNDGWVLLDYKTGGRGKSDEQLLQMYAPQLEWYSKAAARLLGAKVKECWLVMLDTGRQIRSRQTEEK